MDTLFLVDEQEGLVFLLLCLKRVIKSPVYARMSPYFLISYF
ncbi:hypothetical protein GLGR_2808 [Leminorella grimontii ATCC 33999 = DSM 5078]|nr:hypothetical protein GLGR_2808 [Leminorella grimontii ATCC 33999 = DSM 5078]